MHPRVELAGMFHLHSIHRPQEKLLPTTKYKLRRSRALFVSVFASRLSEIIPPNDARPGIARGVEHEKNIHKNAASDPRWLKRERVIPSQGNKQGTSLYCRYKKKQKKTVAWPDETSSIPAW
jgi:hypothetical protein